MKQLTFLFLSIIFLPFVMFNCTPSKHNHATVPEGGLLWEISGNGLNDKSYLFGTMHNIGSAFLDSIPGLWKGFDSVEQVAVECNIIVIDSLPFTMQEYVYMPRGNFTYETLYENQDEFLYVDSVLKKMNPRYFLYKPLFWSVVLNQMKAYEKLSERNDMMDKYILLKAIESQKKTCFMESLDDYFARINHLDSLNYTFFDLSFQGYGLYETLKKLDEAFDDKGLGKAYRNQNLNDISTVMANQNNYIPTHDKFSTEEYRNKIEIFQEYYLKKIGTDRNKKWMDNLLTMIHSAPTLIAVGVGHLMGDEGLIILLREAGYTVNPVE